ncbi:hypothetical protein N9B34_01905 [Akkermansiaceae bacterium]|nr:hypothetical protein [Akkermansiaceae bacterium]
MLNFQISLPSSQSGTLTKPQETDVDLYEIHFRDGAAGYEWELYSSHLTISYSSKWRYLST